MKIGIDVSSVFEPISFISYLGYILILLGVIFGLIIFSENRIKPFLNIFIQSTYKKIPPQSLEEIIDKDNSFWKSVALFNEAHLDNNNDKQLKKLVRRLRKITKRISEKRPLYYCGIAHLPLVGLAGYLLKNFRVDFLEIDHNSRNVFKVEGSNLNLNLLLSYPESLVHTDEIGLSISISRKIDSETITSKLPNLPLVKLENDSFDFSNLRSTADLESFIKKFREILDKVRNDYRNVKRVKIFYAGPTSAMFKLGQNIQTNLDPEIEIYNYDVTNGYSWGLDIKSGGNLVRL